MGQYYTLRNFTRKESANVGKFYGEWDHYLKLFGWSKDDDVTAYGDYGDVMHMNPKAPDDVSEMDAEGVWAMCVFAAKKCGMTPEDFWTEFLNDDAEPNEEKQEWKNIDYYAMEREALLKQQAQKQEEALQANL